ncbi:MAG: GNAT family N-acetyltransferase [Candidatus Kapaibacterium sp.]
MEEKIMQFPVLETERLILREWTDADAGNLVEIFGHESVVQYTSNDAYTSLEDGMRRVNGSRMYFHEKNLGITWGIFERESGNVLGDIDFTYTAKDHFRVILGCSFKPDAWRKGFAAEALTEVIRYGFEDFPLFRINRLEAGTDPRNDPAKKILGRLGFKNEAFLRGYYFEKGKFVDQCIFGLLREDWEKQKVA